jgi:hypothetical protein
MRYFIIENSNKRFNGDSVLDVAKKAAKYLFVNNNKRSIIFSIKETTKNSQNKSYKYKASNVDSRVHIRKYIGGVHTEYKLGDIVTLYDKHADGYISYDDSSKMRLANKYFLHQSLYNTHHGVNYEAGLVAEKDPRKLSYWKLVDTEFQNINSSIVKYLFQLIDSKPPLFLRLLQTRTGGVHNVNYYLSVVDKPDYSCGFEIQNNKINKYDFSIDVQKITIPSLQTLRNRETINF